MSEMPRNTQPVQGPKRAVNSMGVEVNLPPRPERKDFETQDDFEEALSGWNHRVLPLLSLQRHSIDR